MYIMSIIWFCLLVAFAVGEAMTMGLVSVWFCGGALVAMILSFLPVDIWVQILVFVTVSAALLAATRPLAKKYVNTQTHATNLDRVIGQIAVVTRPISNLESLGEVHVDGKYWTARTDDGRHVETGAEVRVLRIEGVKLIVSPLSI